ncbi:MAG: hypothetical protein RI926_630 [Actinomycetota bacterium]|jgi:hypothetical protein
MSTVLISDGKLKVLLSFWEKIGGLSGDISIPLGDVRGATADPTFIKNDLGIRAGGTGFPGLIAEGHFRKNGDRLFAMWRKGEQVVVIELQGQKWDRLVLGCEDAQALAQLINNSK